jgi:glycine/D-amino acid oxidase-like deaminating enzyme
MSKVDVIVIGAGIVGAACAHACTNAGLSVLVLEKDVIGGGTTGAGMGHLVVMDDSEAQFALSSYSRSLWHELATDAPARMEFSPCGTLWIAADDEEMAAVESKLRSYTDHDVAACRLDAPALYEHEPLLRPGLAGALLVPDDAVVYPPAAAAYLLEKARAGGAHVRIGTAVTQIREGGVSLADGTDIEAEHVINAAGCGSPALTADLPVRKRKGHLAITQAHPGMLKHQLVELGYLKSAHAVEEDSVAFNLQPRPSGQILIGSSRQFGANDSRVDPDILGRMLERAQLFMPALEGISLLRCWTGFRPATPNKRPLIGPHPGLPHLWIATGHEGLGITTALGTGELIADLIQGRSPAIDPEPFCPACQECEEEPHA